MQSAQKKKTAKKTIPEKKRQPVSPNPKTSRPFDRASIAIMVLLLGTFFIYDADIRDPYLAPRFIFIAAFLALGFYWFLIREKLKFSISHSYTKGFVGVSIAFITWSVIGTSQSINISESIFFLSREILFLLSFILMYTLLSKKIEHLTTTKSITSILILLSIIGIFQFYNLAFTSIPGDPHPTGVSGNRNLYASLLVLLMPFAFYTLTFANRMWKYISAFAISMGIFAIIIGQTRSAWLAFIVSTLFFQLSFFILRKKLPSKMVRNWLWVSLTAIGAVVVALGIIVLTDKDGLVQERLTNRLKSLYSLNDLNDPNEANRNINERLLVWDGTYKMIKDTPFVGVGPGNWRLVFPKYGGMSALKDDTPVQIDKVRVQPHNVYLHIASETGIPGLLLMLTLGVLILLAAFTNIMNNNDARIILLNLLMAAGIIALAVDMSFSFPNERMEHGVIVALITAFIFSSLEKQNVPTATSFILPNSVFYFAFLPVLVFCIVLGNAKWKFDHYLMKVLEAELKGDYAQVLEAATKGESTLVTLDPVSDPMEFHKARAYVGMGQFDKALEEIIRAEQYHPNSHRIYNTKAGIYLKQNKFQEAIEPLKKALEYSPEYAPALQNLAYSYYRTDQYQASLDILAKMDISKDISLQQMQEDLKRRLANEK